MQIFSTGEKLVFRSLHVIVSQARTQVNHLRREPERKANKLARKTVANRENAQLSTGPVTEAGKAKSSLNALKSGLTGRAVLLATDAAAQYQAHVQSYADHFQPVGPEEQTLVQSLADTAWRLARVPGLEMAIYAQGRIEFADEFEDQNEAVRPALIEAQTALAPPPPTRTHRQRNPRTRIR